MHALNVYMVKRQTERTGERIAEITEPASGCGIIVPLEDIARGAILPSEWPESDFGAGWRISWGFLGSCRTLRFYGSHAAPSDFSLMGAR